MIGQTSSAIGKRKNTIWQLGKDVNMRILTKQQRKMCPRRWKTTENFGIIICFDLMASWQMTCSRVGRWHGSSKATCVVVYIMKPYMYMSIYLSDAMIQANGINRIAQHHPPRIQRVATHSHAYFGISFFDTTLPPPSPSPGRTLTTWMFREGFWVADQREREIE